MLSNKEKKTFTMHLLFVSSYNFLLSIDLQQSIIYIYLKIKSMKGSANQQDLENIYSDLSDHDLQRRSQNNMSRQRSNHQTNQSNANRTARIMGPAGKMMSIPLPPPQSKPSQHNIVVPQQFTQKKTQHAPPGTQINSGARKNILFVKNVPRTINDREKLTTYFRNFGTIKSVKISVEQYSAVVRFQRQQDVTSFLVGNKIILNRSYIVYGPQDNFVVSPEQVLQRQREQSIALQKEKQKCIFSLRNQNDTKIAQKYRALLFLKKNHQQLSNQQYQQLMKEMTLCRNLKMGTFQTLISQFYNDYDWTLSYRIKSEVQIDKKAMAAQYIKKYGFMSSIQTKNEQEGANRIKSSNSTEKSITVSIKFLAVKNSWKMYEEQGDTLKIKVEGAKLKKIFDYWLLKKKLKMMGDKSKNQTKVEEANRTPVNSQQLAQKDQIVDKNEDEGNNQGVEVEKVVNEPNYDDYSQVSQVSQELQEIHLKYREEKIKFGTQEKRNENKKNEVHQEQKRQEQIEENVQQKNHSHQEQVGQQKQKDNQPPKQLQ